MWEKDTINTNDGRKAEVRSGITGRGSTVWFVQWETSGRIDGPFSTLEEAVNWAENS